jgi:hypothetical protein
MNVLKIFGFQKEERKAIYEQQIANDFEIVKRASLAIDKAIEDYKINEPRYRIKLYDDGFYCEYLAANHPHHYKNYSYEYYNFRFYDENGKVIPEYFSDIGLRRQIATYPQLFYFNFLSKPIEIIEKWEAITLSRFKKYEDAEKFLDRRLRPEAYTTYFTSEGFKVG